MRHFFLIEFCLLLYLVYSNPHVLYCLRFILSAFPSTDADIVYHFRWDIRGCLLSNWLPEEGSDAKP